MKSFACRKFELLAFKEDEQDLSAKELLFMQNHETVCESCRMERRADSLGLSLLREAAAPEDEFEDSSSFEDRIIRNLTLANRRDTWRYWWPAGLGAAIAALAAFAAMQLVSGQSSFRPMFFHGQEAANGMPAPGTSISIIRQYDR